MDKIGKLLREARQENNITLDEISQKTKIQKKYLHALEEGDHSLFSGEIYIKGTLRNYAQAIGLNANEILSLYNQLKKQRYLENTVQQPSKKEFNIFFARKKKKVFPGVAYIWIALLAFIFMGSIWYLHGHNLQKNKNISLPEGYFLEDTNEQAKPGLPDDTPVDILPVKKELTVVAESNHEVTYALSGVEQAEITLNFPERCWVRIMQDGAKIEEKIFNAGESKILGDARETLLHLGNPPAARIAVNGLEINGLPRFTSPVKIIIKKK